MGKLTAFAIGGAAGIAVIGAVAVSFGDLGASLARERSIPHHARALKSRPT